MFYYVFHRSDSLLLFVDNSRMLLTEAPYFISRMSHWLSYFLSHFRTSKCSLRFHLPSPHLSMNSLDCPQMYKKHSWHHKTDRQKTGSLNDERDEPYTAELEPYKTPEFEGWVGICYIFCPQEGLPWYKVLQNFLFLYKNKHFCRNPAFKQQLIQSENCRLHVKTDMVESVDSTHCL